MFRRCYTKKQRGNHFLMSFFEYLEDRRLLSLSDFTFVGSATNATMPSTWTSHSFDISPLVTGDSPATLSFDLRNDAPNPPFPPDPTTSDVYFAENDDEYLVHFEYSHGGDTSHWRNVRVTVGTNVFRDQYAAFNNHLGDEFVGTAQQGGGTHRNILGEVGFDAGTYSLVKSQPDIVATTLDWVSGGVEFEYRIDNANLPEGTTAAFYWATGDELIDIIPGPTGGPFYNTTLDTAQGNYGPLFVPVGGAVIPDPPAGATHLLLALDPDNLIQESDEPTTSDFGDNNLQPLSISDIDILGFKTIDSQSVEVEFRVNNDAITEFGFGIFRSSDDSFDLGQDKQIGVHSIAVASPGMIEFAALSTALLIDPSHPYVFGVADPFDDVVETDEDNNEGSFRKHVIGVVTHGYNRALTPTPAWLRRIADTLVDDQGYDASIRFDWARLSNNRQPGRAELAGQELAFDVIDLVNTFASGLPPNDVIDLHMIGHSRGSVVISQALGVLEVVGVQTALERGYFKMTMLDPHPAHNHGGAVLASVSPTIRGRLAERIVKDFQDKARDPEVIVPGNVDEAEVYYQRTSYLHAPSRTFSLFDEQIINLWGEAVPGFRHCDLTGPGVGHREVPLEYEKDVVPTLNQPTAFQCSGTITFPTTPFATLISSNSAIPNQQLQPPHESVTGEFGKNHVEEGSINPSDNLVSNPGKANPDGVRFGRESNKHGDVFSSDLNNNELVHSHPLLGDLLDVMVKGAPSNDPAIGHVLHAAHETGLMEVRDRLIAELRR